MLGGNKQKVIEHAVRIQENLYVLGNVIRDHEGNLVISKGEDKFFISTKTEEQLKKSMMGLSILMYVLGGLLIIGGLVLAGYQLF